MTTLQVFFVVVFIFLSEFTEERKISIIISSVMINVDDFHSKRFFLIKLASLAIRCMHEEKETLKEHYSLSLWLFQKP